MRSKTPPQKLSERLADRQSTRQPAQQATRKVQYDALSRVYTEETERYEALNKRASAYLTVVGAFSVFAVFKIDAIAAKVLASPWTLTLALAAGLLVLIAVALIGWSLRVLDYYTIADPEQIVLAADAEDYTVEDLYSVLLVGLVEATAQNRKMNDLRARTLTWSLWLAVTASILVGATNIMIHSLTR